MMNWKKAIGTVTVLIGVLGAGVVAYAAGADTPAEVLAELTGKSVETVTAERAAGETYGAMAGEAGLLSEFKQKMLELKKGILDQRVKDGKLTQEQADQIYQTMQANQENCTGTGTGGGGKGFGLGLGKGKGQGNGQGMGKGMRGQGGFGQGCTR